MLGEKQIQRVFSFCESTEQRRLAQSEDLRKLPDGENGAYWTIEKEQVSFRMGRVDKKLLQLSGQMQTTVLDNQSCGPELSLCTTKV